MTAEIINLNKVRKAKERAEKERRAEENRLKFGQSRTERLKSEAESCQHNRALDAAKRSHNASDDGEIDPDQRQ